MNGMVKRLRKTANDKNKVELMKSMTDVSGSVNMTEFGFMVTQFSPGYKFFKWIKCGYQDRYER